MIRSRGRTPRCEATPGEGLVDDLSCQWRPGASRSARIGVDCNDDAKNCRRHPRRWRESSHSNRAVCRRPQREDFSPHARFEVRDTARPWEMHLLQFHRGARTGLHERIYLQRALSRQPCCGLQCCLAAKLAKASTLLKLRHSPSAKVVNRRSKRRYSIGCAASRGRCGRAGRGRDAGGFGPN
jgi:hypothetical protein